MQTAKNKQISLLEVASHAPLEVTNSRYSLEEDAASGQSTCGPSGTAKENTGVLSVRIDQNVQNLVLLWKSRAVEGHLVCRLSGIHGR